MSTGASAGALATIVVVIAGCGSAAKVPAPRANAYLQRLSAEQTKLATAERRIPRRAASPAALARAISLLGDAVHRLERDLSAINPPDPVSKLHARLVLVAHGYRSQLEGAARTASRPGGEVAAAQTLTSSTDFASRAFSSTVASIKSKLRGSR